MIVFENRASLRIAVKAATRLTEKVTVRMALLGGLQKSAQVSKTIHEVGLRLALLAMAKFIEVTPIVSVSVVLLSLILSLDIMLDRGQDQIQEAIKEGSPKLVSAQLLDLQ